MVLRDGLCGVIIGGLILGAFVVGSNGTGDDKEPDEDSKPVMVADVGSGGIESIGIDGANSA